MTKLDEKKLLGRISSLERQVADLYMSLENNKFDKHVYTVAEVARILEITPQAVYFMIHREELETVKLGTIKVLGDSLRGKLGVVNRERLGVGY